MPSGSRKTRKTFTLSRESLTVLRQVEKEKHLASASAALDEILREKRRELELARTEASIAAYYHGLTEAQYAENEAWGEIAESQFPLE